jgi:hypothetical protein
VHARRRDTSLPKESQKIAINKSMQSFIYIGLSKFMKIEGVVYKFTACFRQRSFELVCGALAMLYVVLSTEDKA